MRCPFARQLATAVRSAATERATDTGLLMRDMWPFLRPASTGEEARIAPAYLRLKTSGQIVTTDLHSPTIMPLSSPNTIHLRNR
jgi:hypothetical protein